MDSVHDDGPFNALLARLERKNKSPGAQRQRQNPDESGKEMESEEVLRIQDLPPRENVKGG